MKHPTSSGEGVMGGLAILLALSVHGMANLPSETDNKTSLRFVQVVRTYIFCYLCMLTVFHISFRGKESRRLAFSVFITSFSSIVFSSQIFRHGDRAPTGTYPNDPYKNNETVWPEGMAQLTSVSLLSLM